MQSIYWLTRLFGLAFSRIRGYSSCFCQSCRKKFGDLDLMLKSKDARLIVVCKRCYAGDRQCLKLGTAIGT